MFATILAVGRRRPSPPTSQKNYRMFSMILGLGQGPPSPPTSAKNYGNHNVVNDSEVGGITGNHKDSIDLHALSKGRWWPHIPLISTSHSSPHSSRSMRMHEIPKMFNDFGITFEKHGSPSSSARFQEFRAHPRMGKWAKT